MPAKSQCRIVLKFVKELLLLVPTKRSICINFYFMYYIYESLEWLYARYQIIGIDEEATGLEK